VRYPERGKKPMRDIWHACARDNAAGDRNSFLLLRINRRAMSAFISLRSRFDFDNANYHARLRPKKIKNRFSARRCVLDNGDQEITRRLLNVARTFSADIDFIPHGGALIENLNVKS